MSVLYRKDIIKILVFGLLCSVFGLIYSLIEKALIGSLDHYPVTGNPYNFSATAVITTLGGFMLGVLLGTFEVFVANRYFEKGTFGGKVSTKTGFYVLTLSLFFILATMGASSTALKKPLWDSDVLDDTYLFVTNFTFWAILIYSGAIISLILFILDMSDNIGQQVVKNFMLGRYHRPLKEERIFMFLDMRSSTTIAEKLGHYRYFSLLKSYYALMTDPILESKGEIYQYVGDEVVISWSPEDGIKSSNFLNCFFKIKEVFERNTDSFQKEYGLMPTFKAGLHFGQVTTGEIGQIKKEVLFTGDVLNTTARIQGLCNEYGVDLLISEELLAHINLSTKYEKRAMGEFELRGRESKIKLCTVLDRNSVLSD